MIALEHNYRMSYMNDSLSKALEEVVKLKEEVHYTYTVHHLQIKGLAGGAGISLSTAF